MNKVTIEEILDKEGIYMCPTVGDSMEPLLKNRLNTVVIKKSASPLKKYDIALYYRPTTKSYVLHRVVKVKEKKQEYLIVGDNRWRKERVPFSWVIGVFAGYYEGERYIDVNDEEYIKYSKRIVRNYPFRAIKLIIRRILRKR